MLQSWGSRTASSLVWRISSSQRSKVTLFWPENSVRPATLAANGLGGELLLGERALDSVLSQNGFLFIIYTPNYSCRLKVRSPPRP